MRVLNDDYYLPEIREKLIKLSTQFIQRHLNFIAAKVNEKKSMSTERILFILEDLHLLSTALEL